MTDEPTPTMLDGFDSHGLCIVDGQWVGELLTWPLPEVGAVEVAKPRRTFGLSAPVFERIRVNVTRVQIPNETWLSK